MAKDNSKWHIFTDGACSGNPGPGGWGAVVIGDGKKKELGGGHPKTTNNRMEMKAAIEALKILPDDANAILFTDSSYVMNGITKWIHGWKRNNWERKDRSGRPAGPVLNKEMWQELDSLNRSGIEWRHVKGHAAFLFNERCDEIAVAFSKKERAQLYDGPLDESELETALAQLEAAPRRSSKSKKKSSSKKSSGGKKTYYFAYKGSLYRFSKWPSCQNFSSGKPGYTKACASESELRQYASACKLPPSALDNIIDMD